MAIGLLVQSKQANIEELHTFGFIGELSLNAELRPCTGVLPMAIEATNGGSSCNNFQSKIYAYLP